MDQRVKCAAQHFLAIQTLISAFIPLLAAAAVAAVAAVAADAPQIGVVLPAGAGPDLEHASAPAPQEDQSKIAWQGRCPAAANPSW